MITVATINKAVSAAMGIDPTAHIMSLAFEENGEAALWATSEKAGDFCVVNHPSDGLAVYQNSNMPPADSKYSIGYGAGGAG